MSENESQDFIQNGVNRIKSMHAGYLRATIVFYFLLLIILGVKFIIESEKWRGNEEIYGVWFLVVLFLYWPATRVYLWVYDGFIEDKQNKIS